MNTTRFAILAAALLAPAAAALVPEVALAHGSMRPQHGGVVQLSGETLFELVRGPDGVDIYISEEDEPLPAGNYTAELIVTDAMGAKTKAPLTAAAANRFTAPALRPAAGSKLVVALIEKGKTVKTFATFRL